MLFRGHAGTCSFVQRRFSGMRGVEQISALIFKFGIAGSGCSRVEDTNAAASWEIWSRFAQLQVDFRIHGFAQVHNLDGFQRFQTQPGAMSIAGLGHNSSHSKFESDRELPQVTAGTASRSEPYLVTALYNS